VIKKINMSKPLAVVDFLHMVAAWRQATPQPVRSTRLVHHFIFVITS
jgi:hypothetical protein